jgi:hypothetical protein
MALAAFFLFFNLGDRLLWGDEAETALLARNVLRYGVPKSSDGVNQITILGAQVDSNAAGIWTWSPWLKEYVTALGFAVFGHTAWGARVLFAFCGWLSVGLLAWVAYRIYANHWIALSAALLLATSEAFLLHARQCRYYSFVMFAEILLLYGMHQLLQQNWRGILSVAAALILQFYGNYLVVAANLPALLVLGVVLFLQQRRTAWRLPASLALVFLAALPWVIYAKIFGQAQMAGTGLSAMKMWQYAIEINFHFLPWLMFLLPLIGWARARRAAVPAGSATIRPVTTLEVSLMVLVPAYVAVVTVPPDGFLRYVIALLPVLCLLAAAWVYRHLRSPQLALALVLIQCSTNLFAVIGGYPWKFFHRVHSPLYTYLEGTRSAYADRVSDVVRFFKQEGRPGQTLYSFDPEFALIYYTGFKVTDARLNGGQLPVPMPDWILSETASGLRPGLRVGLAPAVAPHYDAISFDVHDSRRDGSMPEPDSFEYHPVPNFTEFLLYRKKK